MARKKDDVYLGLVGDTPRAEDDDAQAITPGLKKTPSGLFWPSIPSIKKDEEKKREEDEEEEYDEKELDDLFASYLRAYLGTQGQVDKNRGRPLKTIAEEVVGTLEGNEERAQDRRLLKEVLFDVGAYATSCEWVDDEHILTESWDGVSRLWNPSMQVMVREDRTKERDNRDFDFVHAFVEGVQRKVRRAQMRLFAMDAPVSNKRRRLAKSQQIWKDGGYWRPSKALGAMAMSAMMMPTMGVPAAAVVFDDGELSQWKRGKLEKYRAIQQNTAEVQSWAVRLAQLENEPFGQLFRFNERDSEIVEMRKGIVDGILGEIRDEKVNQMQMRRMATNILMRQEQAYDFIRYWANVENNDYKFLMGKLFAALLDEEQEAPKTTWVPGEQKNAVRNPKIRLDDGTEQEDRDLYVMTIKCVPPKQGIPKLFTMEDYYMTTFPDGAALTTPQAVRGSADRNDEDDEAGMDFRPGLGMSGEMMPPEAGVVMLGPKASSGAAEKQKKDDRVTFNKNVLTVRGSKKPHEVWEILQKDQYKDLRVEWTITWLEFVLLNYTDDAFTTFMYGETKEKGKEVLEFIAQSCVMVVEKMFGKNASDDFDYDKKKWFVHNVLMAKMKGRGKEKKEKKKEGDKEGKSKKDKKKDGGDKYPWDFLRKAYKAYKSLVKSSVSDVELPIKEYANLLEEDRLKWVNGIMGDKAALQKNFGKTERARFVLAEIEGVLGTKIVRVARNDEERSKALQSLKNEDEAVRREKVRLARIVVESKSGNIASDEMMIAIERYVDYVGDNQGGAVRERWMQEKRESQVEEARERLERDRQERAEAQRRREQEEAEAKRKREKKRLKGMNTVDVGQGERKRKDDALDEFQNRREIIYEQTKDSESPPQGGPLLFTKLTFYVHNPDQVKSLAVAPGKLGYGLDAAEIFALEPRKPAVSRAAAAAAAARAAAAGATDSDEEEEEEEEDEDVEMEAHPLQSTQQKPPLLLGAPADGEDEQAGASSPPGAAAASSSSSTGEGGRQRASGGSGGSRPAAAGLRVRRLPPEAGINRYGFNALSVFGVATGELVNGAAFSESFQYEASERMMVTVSDPEDHAKVMMLPLASDGSQLPVAMRSFRLDDAYGLHNWRPRQQDGDVKGTRPGMNYSMLLSGRMPPNLQKMENRYQPVAFSRNAEESVCVLFVDKEIAETFAEADRNCYDLREINTNLMAGGLPFVLLVYDRYGRLSTLMHNETEGSYIDAARLRLARVNVIPEAIGSKLREGEDWKGPDGESKPNIFVDKFGVQLDYLKLTLRDGTRLYAGLEEGDGWGDAVGRYQYKRLQDMRTSSELLVLKMYTQDPQYREGDDAAPADGVGKDDERDEDEDPDEESWEKREEKKARMERRKAERMQREIGDGTEWSTVSKDQYDRRTPVFTRYVESAQVVVEVIPENNAYFVRAIRFLNRETDDAASIINYDLTFDRVRPLRRERLPDNTYRQSYAYNPWHDEEFRVMYEQMDRLILETQRDDQKKAEYQKMVELETLKSKENKKKKEEEEKKAQAEAEQQKKDSVDILSSARSTWGEAAKQTLAERQAKHAAEQARRAAQERARLAAEEKARRDAEFEAEQEAAKLLEEQRKAAKKMPAMPAAAGKEKKRRSKKSKKKGQDDENDAEDQQEGQPDDQQPGQEQQQQQQDVPEGEDQGEGAGGPEQGEDDQTNNVDDDQGHADEEYYDADVMQAEAEAMLGGGEETSRYDYISEVMKMRDTRLGKLDLHGIGGRRIPWFMRLTRTHPRTKIIFPEYKDYNRYGLYEVFVKQVWGEMKEAAAGGGQTQQGGSAREEAEDEEVRQFREERAKEAINGMQTCTFFFTSALGYGVRDITVTKEPESGGMCKVELLLETFNLTHIETGKEQLTEEERARAMTEVMQRLPKPTARDREVLQEKRRERERLLAEERSRKNQEYMRRKAEAEAEERRKEKEQRKKEKEERKKQELEERKQRLKEDGVEIEEAEESSSSSSSSSSDDEDEQPGPRAAATTNEDRKKSGGGGGTGGSDGFLPSGPSGGGGSSRPPASSTPSGNSGGNGAGTAPIKPKKGNRNNDRGYEGFGGGGGGGGGVSFRSGGGGGGGRGWHGGTVNRNNGVRQMFGINAKGVYRHDARQNAHFAYFKSGKDQSGPARRWMYQNGVLHKQKKGASGTWEDHFSSDSYNREATAGWDDEEYDDQFDEDLDDWWEGQQNGYSDDDRSSRYSDRDYDSGRDDYDPREDDYDSGRDDYDSRDDEHDPRDDGYDDPRDPRNWDQYGDDDDDRYDQDDDPYGRLYGDDDDDGGRGGRGKGKGRGRGGDPMYSRIDDASAMHMVLDAPAPASYSARPIVKTAEKGIESRAVRQLQKSPLAKAIPGKLRRTVVRVRWDGVVELMRIRSKQGGVLPKEDRIGPVQVFSGGKHEGAGTCVCVIPHLKVVATGGVDGTVRVWDPKTMHAAEGIEVIRQHGAVPVRCIAASPDGQLLASGDQQGVLVICRLATPELNKTCTRLSLQRGDILCASWSPEGRFLAVGTRDASITVFEWRNNKMQQCAVLVAHTAHVHALEWAPNGKYLASVGADGTLRIWDFRRSTFGGVLATELTRGCPILAHFDQIWAVRWSPNGTRIATCGKDGYLAVWYATKLIRFAIRNRC